MIRSCRIDKGFLIIHKYKFKDIIYACDLFENRKDYVIKKAVIFYSLAVNIKAYQEVQMKINTFCLTCLIRMQESQIPVQAKEDMKMEYMREILSFLSTCDPELSAPALVRPLTNIYEKYWGKVQNMEQCKKDFNDFLLLMEKDIESQIRNSEDPLKNALIYARTGNYIDYTSVQNVSAQKLLELFSEHEHDVIDEGEYEKFLADLENAKKLIYLTDNCGEIVLDKIVLKLIKELYPELEIKVVVRGAAVANDADMESAVYVGLDQVVSVIENGSDIAGTDLSDISKKAKDEIEEADVIISKGQGNFETLHGCRLNVYYLFLCKCDWFVRKFHAERFQGMFINENRISF